MTTSIIGVIVLENMARDTTDKWADLRILHRYAMLELRRAIQEETTVHNEHIQYLEK
jgi:hypothetical protein